MENRMGQSEEAGDEVLKAVGALEESSEELEEVVTEYDDEVEAVESMIVWVAKIFRKIMAN